MFKKTCLTILAVVMAVSFICIFTSCKAEEEEVSTIDYYSIEVLEVVEGSEYSLSGVSITMHLTGGEEQTKKVTSHLKYDTENIVRVDNGAKVKFEDIVVDGKYTTPYVNVAEKKKGVVQYRMGVTFLEEAMKDKDNNDIFLTIEVSPLR